MDDWAGVIRIHSEDPSCALVVNRRDIAEAVPRLSDYEGFLWPSV